MTDDGNPMNSYFDDNRCPDCNGFGTITEVTTRNTLRKEECDRCEGKGHV